MSAANRTNIRQSSSALFCYFTSIASTITPGRGFQRERKPEHNKLQPCFLGLASAYRPKKPSSPSRATREAPSGRSCTSSPGRLLEGELAHWFETFFLVKISTTLHTSSTCCCCCCLLQQDAHSSVFLNAAYTTYTANSVPRAHRHNPEACGGASRGRPNALGWA